MEEGRTIITAIEFVREAGIPEAQEEAVPNILEEVVSFKELMFRYSSAMSTLKTRLEILNEEFSVLKERTPIQSIKSRLKKPRSIAEKLMRKGLPLTCESIRDNLNDVAGVRVICAFIEDIYEVASMLGMQDDIEVLDVRDYIASPKENGYRSLHLIVSVPVYYSDQKHLQRVEVQIRTIAMDFWASLEHQLKYKKEIANAAEISAELKACADQITCLDVRMQSIRHKLTGEGDRQ